MRGEHLARNIAIGATGGLLATWVMTISQSRMQKLAKDLLPPGPKRNQESEEDPATVKLAERVSHQLIHRDLPESRKEQAGQFVHYAFGTLMGATFGALLDLAPRSRLASGLLFGTGVWMLADNVAVPAFGLSKPPTEVPLRKNLYALGAHLVYGATLGAAARAGESGLGKTA